MARRVKLGLAAGLLACTAGAAWSATAPSASEQEQREADDRVIAARCGTPAFEKQFFRSSQAAVRATSIARGRRPEDSEKAITALRRSPFILVSSNADCAAQLDRLKEVMRARPAQRGSQKSGNAR
ncbi:MAG: hypothetical protein KJ901_19335 [Gammaproteobacteria bacterium]|nr:hypothetical protein [Gammaproteobacteria bacterium]